MAGFIYNIGGKLNGIAFGNMEGILPWNERCAQYINLIFTADAILGIVCVFVRNLRENIRAF